MERNETLKTRSIYIVKTYTGDEIPVETTCPEVAAHFVEIIMGYSHGPFKVE